MYPSHLLDPIDVGGLRIRNRLVLTASVAVFTEHRAMDGDATASEELTRGRYGLWMLDAGGADPDSRIEPSLFDESALPLLKAIARMAARKETPVFQRLSHGALFPASAQCADSVCQGHGGWRTFRSAETRLGFVSAALMCQESGLDGVEICASDAGQLHQFHSGAPNDRNDGDSGSGKKRYRFLLETVRAVRAAVGPDFVVGAGVGANDGIVFDVKGNATALLRELESEQLLDFISVSGPTSPYPFGTRRLPRVMTRHCGSPEEAAQVLAAGAAELLSVSPMESSYH